MAIYTTPYDLAKPTVGGADDADQWGGLLNDNMDIINDELDVAQFSHVLAKTATYLVTTADQNALITGDVSGGGFSVTLPSAASAGDGWKVTVKKIDGSSNTLTVVGTIDGVSNDLITSQNAGATYCSNGTIWYKFATVAGTTGGAGTLPIDQGGTGATTAAGARTNLGLGTMATQNASAVAITGGTLTGVNISGSTISGIAGLPVVTNAATGRIVIGAVTLQWGSTATQTFSTPFSGNPYSVVLTASGTNSVQLSSTSASGFTYTANPGAVLASWIAIGPT